jgi:aldehyde dehydrogenase (NAD+)
MSFLEYAPAPESRGILNLRDAYGLFIDGEFAEGTGESFATISPADESHIATISAASEADVDRAVAAARRAYERTWSKMSGRDRGKYLFRIARLVQERARELAVAESLDNGKPIKESRDVDVPLVAAWFFYYAGWADKLDYAGLGASPRALGVAGQVIPWNFPLLMLAWKIAPALAAGNTVVLKPAETTPLSALIFAEILQQADLPPGVVNIVTGAGATGAALVSHPDVDKVAFTGSTGVGRAIAKEVAGSGKKLTLELGGKAANIVFDDAPIDQAIEGIVNGIFFNQGHVCCAGSRLLVQENVHDEVVDRLKERLSTLRMGDPLDKNTDIGAINSRAQLDRIRALSKIGEEEGADRWSPDCVIPENGFWFAPTIFTNVQASHRIAREEIFGPVLSVLTFRTPAEAIAKANNTPYGLSAGIWTDKGSRILAVADRLRAGVIWANTLNRFDPASPFGGYKESGYGREGGRHGLAAYLAPGSTAPRARQTALAAGATASASAPAARTPRTAKRGTKR